MGSASRPQRRGRPPKASYKESCSEGEDEDSHIAQRSPSSKASESKDTTRRKLALKRVSRSQEQAEALQIQKAIEESISQENAGIMSLDRVADSKAVDNSEKAVVDSEEEAPDVRYTDHKQEDTKNLCREESPQEQLKGSRAGKEEDEDWASGDADNDDDEDEDSDSENVTEDENSDAMEDFNRKRKGPLKSRHKRKQLPSNGRTEQKPFAASVKKPRTARAVTETGGQSAVKRKQGTGIKSLAHAQIADCSDVTPAKGNKVSRLKGVSLKGCKSALDGTKALNAHGNAVPFDRTPFENSGALAFSPQSPTGLHRRVIGLSRRFKPPPLHPYLSRAES